MNKEIVYKSYPVTLIQEIMSVICQFKYVTVIDLVMGYCSMEFDYKAKGICVICLLYQYNALPMWLLISSDVFQEVIGWLMLDLENVYCYLYDIILIGNNSYRDRHK